jgi:hypothetical protein
MVCPWPRRWRSIVLGIVAVPACALPEIKIDEKARHAARDEVDASTADAGTPKSVTEYTAFDGPLDWQAAKNSCDEIGGELAVPTTEAQNARVLTACASTPGGPGGNYGCWIGAPTTGATWSNWAPGEPSGNGDCVWIYSTRDPAFEYPGNWDDERCAFATAYVCQRSE